MLWRPTTSAKAPRASSPGCTISSPGGSPNSPGLRGIRTPDWLAEYVLQEELGLGKSEGRSVLDPRCGPGTFLATAVRLHADRLAGQGQDDFDSLLYILDRVMGMDIHPLAVTLARTNYLLSLGGLVQGVHAPVLLPVYLSGPIGTARNPGSSVLPDGGSEPVYAFHTEIPEELFQVPDSVASNLKRLDWLFARLPNYLRGAQTRGSKGDDDHAQTVLTAYYNYLVAAQAQDAHTGAFEQLCRGYDGFHRGQADQPVPSGRRAVLALYPQESAGVRVYGPAKVRLSDKQSMPNGHSRDSRFRKGGTA